MSCRCHLVHETGFQGSPRFDNSQNDSHGSQKHSTYKNKCPGLDDQAWNALSSLREKTCRMFSSESEGTGTDISARSPHANELLPECGNIVRKANDLIDYAPESEFLKKMKLQCQYLQSNQANIFSALDEGIQDDCFEYHEPQAQPAQMGGPMYSTPTNQTFTKYNYDDCPQMDYADYNDMDLYPFSFELECNAQNLQSQPAVEVSFVEPQIQFQQNEEGKSEHVSRSRKPVKCRGRRKRKSGNAGKCESENQFEPTLKKPHENSCDRCWRYASPSRSPVNKPDQKYDPNFRRGHSRTDFESGDGNLRVRESYTSPCPDSETDTKDPSPPRIPVQNAPGRLPSPKPATSPEQYQEPLTAQYYPSPRDMQTYPRVQSSSPPRNMQNYPVGIQTTTVPAAMPQPCPGGLPSTFTVTKPTRSAAVPNYQTEPPSWISTMPRPPCVRSSSPVGTALPPTISPNYSSSQSASPAKTMQNYSGAQWSMQNSSGGQSSLLSNTMPTPPSVQSPSRGGQNYSSPGRNVQNYSGHSSSVPGSIPRPASSPRPIQNCPCPQPPPPTPSLRPPSAPSPRRTSPNTVNRKLVQFDQSPLRATDRSVQNFNQPCPPGSQGMIYTASGRKERPKSVIPDMGSSEVNRCYNGAQDLDVTDYKIFTPRTKDQVYQSGNSIHTSDPNNLNESQYVSYSINDETYDVPMIPPPGSKSPENTSSRQSPTRRHSPENTSRQSPARRQSPGGLESIPEGKTSSTKSPKSTSPKKTSKYTSPKSASPNRGKTCTPKSKSPDRTGSGHKKSKTKSPSPKPGTSKEASKSPKKSPQKPSPTKSSNASGEKQHGTTERSPIAGPSKDYHCGAKTDAAKAKEWYIDSDHPLRECTCFPRVPIFKNDPDNYNGDRIFCCHCDWNKAGNKPRSGSGEKQTMSGSCNCSTPRTPQTPKAFDGISFPCPYRDVSNSRNNGQVPAEGGSEQQRSTRSSPQQQQRSARSSPQQQQGGAKPSPQQQQQGGSKLSPQQQQSGSKPSPQQQQQGGTKPSPQQQQQNLSSNPAECPPRKYVVYYMTQCKEKKRDDDDVEVLVEEFSRCPKESDSRTKDITEKMKRIMDCPSDSMALRFQKGVSESTRTPPSSRILYF